MELAHHGKKVALIEGNIYNNSLLALNACPQHLIIVGTNYPGLDLAQIRCNSNESIIHHFARIAEWEDEDASVVMLDFLHDEEIGFYL